MRWLIHFFNQIDRSFARAVELCLMLILFFMGGVTLLQVILRDVFDSGIANAEILSRHMVLWITFLGAMLGTRTRGHIAIDMVARLLPRRPRNALRILLDAVACIVSYYLMKASYAFVLDEKMMGGMLVGNIPTWWAQAVIPFGFAVISFEYAIGIVLDIKRIREVGDRHTAGDWRRYISN
ncbi:MAG: hypothetical protein A3I05_08585 [Deltaproteobacteria bacterium RIFCSPLOWO2_02_FULL_44_10]|nr:MAG: hypothetical protein A3C46_05630 [Deltaproteobacteria bacterium RIFCSPHIGHO2_02_FULL_44_16]OGQ45536.1 MAG: hypothetical protein A3I05_08585 [Deltaproteobacteria bacterium RIFCSPLOWO2_02_FULL_44_10]